jgi:hypothetical protein
MKTTIVFSKTDFLDIFIQAFTAKTDKPLRDPSGKIRKELVSGLAVFFVSVVFWFLMNISFQPRFMPVPFFLTPWIFVSLGANFCFGFVLLLSRKTRGLALIPFLFTLFPLTFIILVFSAENIRKIIPATSAGRGLDWKFVYDGLFFLVELFFIGFFFFLSRTGNPFPLKKQPFLPMRKLIRFLEFLFIAVVLSLLVILCLRFRFPFRRFLRLIKYQLPFAVLLGLKEELLFRWVLLRLGERFLGSRLISVCFWALAWSVYHGFFGEGVGVGFWPAFWVCIVSFWWSLLSYRYRSLWTAWFGHVVIELYGFYLMYIPFLA